MNADPAFTAVRKRVDRLERNGCPDWRPVIGSRELIDTILIYESRPDYFGGIDRHVTTRSRPR